MIVPLFYLCFIKKYRDDKVLPVEKGGHLYAAAGRFFDYKNYIPIFAIFLGFLATNLIIWHQTGDPIGTFKAQDYFISNNKITNIFNIGEWFSRNFYDATLSFHGFTNSFLDRSFFIFYFFILISVFKYQKKELALFAAIVGIVPALSGGFMSYIRYLVVIFPIFAQVAIFLQKENYYRYFVYAFFIGFQTYFIIQYSINNWVA